jgi:hypothetical protein
VVDHDGKKSGGCKMKREDSITEKNWIKIKWQWFINNNNNYNI